MAASSARIPVDAVVGFDVIGFLVARLALVLVALAVGTRLDAHRRRHGGGAGTCTQHAKEIATANLRLIALPHGRILLGVHSPCRRVTTAARKLRSRWR